MRTVLFILLVGCVPTGKPSTPAAATAETGESAPDTASGPAYDITSGALVAALPWRSSMAPFAGYAGTGADGGFYVADPLGDGSQAFIHRLPWGGSDAATVEDAAEVTISTGLYGPDKLGTSGALLSIPDADATADGIEHAGIGYLVEEPAASGALADLATYAMSGGYETGYTGRVIVLDADGDGADDDLLVTATRDERGVSNGALAVYLDATPGAYFWTEADFEVPACLDHDDTSIKYGPVDVVIDASNTILYVACPAANYADGSVELWSLPLGADAEPFAYVHGVGGWTVEPDPRGGAWMGSQGSSIVGYVSADGATVYAAYPASDEGTGFGADPVAVTTSTGQTLLIVGQQTRTPAFAAPRLSSLTLPATIDAGPASATADETTESTGALWICDITTAPEIDDGYAALACAAYTRPEDSGVACVGGIQGAHEQDGVLTIASAGWVFGDGAGCGVAMWLLTGG